MMTASTRGVQDAQKGYRHINYIAPTIRPKARPLISSGPSMSSKGPDPTPLNATWIVWCEVLFLWVDGSPWFTQLTPLFLDPLWSI